MSPLLQSSEQAVQVPSTSMLLLRHRLKLVEDLWESVLLSECGPQMVDLLRQLRSMCSPEGQTAELPEQALLELIEHLDLDEAIRAARGFALYFQLINIVEQHYEQREQQLARSATYKHGSDVAGRPALAVEHEATMTAAEAGNGHEPAQPPFGVQQLERSWQDTSALHRKGGTFHWLFPYLFQQNMPPQHIQRLLNNLDIRLVFTAHPTEIVRHTIRRKQRRIDRILHQLDRAEEAYLGLGLSYSWEAEEATRQLNEEIRLWWRTDELHQFKPTVLDEVDYTLHYFEEVLFDAVPQLAHRLKQALHSVFPGLNPPHNSFCYFGSWVGSDRDGNPSVTPPVTWRTACYQRDIVLENIWIHSTNLHPSLLSLSLHWSSVLPELLDSL
ncbi:MAG: phosphoenolpyruvate carboxylase, partial [Spirulinaceae cyanobacterium RM2_2_10]|nr:phosphoenolpyruvate carboxylase [Spirulinaceae cyanobacterium RM2_2_10]